MQLNVDLSAVIQLNLDLPAVFSRILTFIQLNRDHPAFVHLILDLPAGSEPVSSIELGTLL
jgi:hypothetical protein